MTTQHTQGPWTVEESDDRGWDGWYAVAPPANSDDSPDLAVAICFHGGGGMAPSDSSWSEDALVASRSKALANARLIAAAPGLLAALERLLNAFQADSVLAPTLPARVSWETNGAAVEQARAAIARAKGE